MVCLLARRRHRYVLIDQAAQHLRLGAEIKIAFPELTESAETPFPQAPVERMGLRRLTEGARTPELDGTGQKAERLDRREAQGHRRQVTGLSEEIQSPSPHAAVG